ncbi:hypothetical protein TgHK011_007793 [Trichoderma gracile]|nr:hypothetical protein TgHK011_007793 [Trichoderma gracile]
MILFLSNQHRFDRLRAISCELDQLTTDTLYYSSHPAPAFYHPRARDEAATALPEADACVTFVSRLTLIIHLDLRDPPQRTAEPHLGQTFSSTSQTESGSLKSAAKPRPVRTCPAPSLGVIETSSVSPLLPGIMSTSSGTPESWIASFCALPGHEYFAEVSEEFIEDDFNLTGLQTQVAMYKEALEMILDVEPEDDEDEEEEEEDDDENESGLEEADRADLRHGAERRHHSRMASDLSVIESSAEMLYGLIHQRFICSRVGIQQMSEKYEFGHFGCCPRTHCEQARTLPVGLSDIPGEDTVKLFCPSCLDVYVPPNSRFQTVDGAFFGRTFGALFLLTFPEYDLTKRGADVLSTTNSKVPDDERIINGMYAKNIAPGLGRGHIYEPKIYGFKVSERARSGPRMQWLRDRPDDITELDEARLYHEQNPDSEEEDDEAMAVNGRALVRRRLPGNARLRQRQNHSGSPMALSANGAESEL